MMLMARISSMQQDHRAVRDDLIDKKLKRQRCVEDLPMSIQWIFVGSYIHLRRLLLQIFSPMDLVGSIPEVKLAAFPEAFGTDNEACSNTESKGSKKI